MELLVTYDVATDTAAGRRRLRRVAKLCEAHGQRVQKSVFECIVNAAQYEALRHRLRSEINEAEDSLRIYRLREPHRTYTEIFGIQPEFNPREPLIV